MERVVMPVKLETFVSCADPFQNFRCKETKRGSRIFYKPVRYVDIETIGVCCNGYRESSTQTCDRESAFIGVVAVALFVVAAASS